MSRFLARLRALVIDRPRVNVCERCGSVSVCDTTCRAEAARDRNVARYVSVRLPR